MDVRLQLRLYLLTLVAIFCLKAKAESSSSVVLIDGASHRYLRNQPQGGAETSSMSLQEVSAMVSVLLGFAPPFSLAADSSLKLNEVLLPNPFDKPHAVFLLEVSGIDDPPVSSEKLDFHSGSIYKSRVVGPSKAAIQLPDEDEVFVLPLDESVGVECNAGCLDKELSNIGNWLGGSFSGSLEAMDGKLVLPLASGGTLNLHLEKEAERQFASGFISLLKGIKRGVELHEEFSGSIVSPAELIIGHFSGIKALKGEYGPTDIVQQGIEVFHNALAKSLDLLQKTYEGKIVVVVIYKNDVSSNSEAMIDVTSLPRVARFLEEASSDNSTYSEAVLVRRTLAWITGIILLVSTLIGVCLLMNMPFTRDTLLYSNVKLD